MNVKRTLRMGVVQMASSFGHIEQNSSTMVDFMARASEKCVNLLCFPEAVVQGFPACEEEFKRLPELALSPEDAAVRRICSAAEQNGLVAVFGCVEASPVKPNNSIFVCDRDGEIVGRYAKTHMSIARGRLEGDFFQPGDDLPVLDTSLGRLGVLNCFDGLFPETTRVLSLKGAELLLWTLSPFGSGDVVAMLAPVRAFDSGLPLAVASASGRSSDGGVTFGGHSRICDAEGQVLAELGEAEQGLIVADVTLNQERPRHVERRLCSGRRPDLYGNLCDTTGMDDHSRGAPESTASQCRRQAGTGTTHRQPL